MFNKNRKWHIPIGVASAMFLTGAIAQYIAGYIGATLLGLVLGLATAIASYRTYKLYEAELSKARKEEAERKAQEKRKAERANEKRL